LDRTRHPATLPGFSAAEDPEGIAAEGTITQKQEGTITEVDSPVLAGRLSSRELANHYGLGPERVRKALERYRKEHDEAWVEVTDRRPREPQYLYDPKAVAQLLERMRQS